MRNGLSCSESGKLGAIAVQQIIRDKKQERVHKYELNPNLCKKCCSPIPYEKKINIFCSHSCSASINNLGVRRHGSAVEKACKKCGKTTSNPQYCSRKCALDDYNKTLPEIIPVANTHKDVDLIKNKCLNCGVNISSDKYCSRRCQAEYLWNESVKYMKEKGCFYGCEAEVTLRRKYKKYLKEVRDIKCEICGTTTWMSKEIPLILDHIDGNADNWNLDNLRLVCGNCNMQLPTFTGRNRGKGRKSRRVFYKRNGYS